MGISFEYNKHCYDSSIGIDDKVFNCSDERKEYKGNEEFLRESILKLLDKQSSRNIEDCYITEIYKEYEKPVSISLEEQKKALIEHYTQYDFEAQSHSWYSFTETIKYLIENLCEIGDDDYHFCEQCRDQNFNYSIKI